MKSDKLIDAIGMVDEELIEKSEIPKKNKSKIIKIRWVSSIAAMLVVAIALSIFLPNMGNPIQTKPTTNTTIKSTTAVATEKSNPTEVSQEMMTKSEYRAQYPIMAQYNSVEAAWYADQQKQRAYRGRGRNLDPFLQSTISEFLSDTKDENKLYSPLNVYMALAITAETTDTTSRQQILDLLGAESIGTLRSQAHAIWNANYNDDGLTKSILASSLWLSDKRKFNAKTIEKIVDNYYASTFIGEMGTEDFNKTYRDWLNKQTGDLLKDQIDDKELDEDLVMAIDTTLYYKAPWMYPFEKSETKQAQFYSKNGTKMCDFMNGEMLGDYYWGENFSAVSKKTQDDGEMFFILPDEGVDVESLLNDKEALDFMTFDFEWKNSKRMEINLSVPKFDVSSEMELSKNLKNLGVTDCFAMGVADFSPLLSDEDELADKDLLYVDTVNHGVRVGIDEESVTGAAYTEILLAAGANPPDDKIDFVVNRPFIFVVKSSDSLPLFVGIVNQV